MNQKATLSTNQRRALDALLTCSTVTEAAKKAGLVRGTLHRYLSDPTFKAELHARQDQVIDAATAALSHLAGAAIATLRAILDDEDASASVRVRASLGVLAHVRQLSEFADITERITALERAVDNE
jgi:phage terminase small subunit